MSSVPFEPVVHEFLSSNLRTILFSRRADGSPTGHPMSAFYGDDGLYFNTYTKSAKVRNLRRDGQMTCVITPFGEAASERGVVVRGSARFVAVDEQPGAPDGRSGLMAARTASPNGSSDALDAEDPAESERRRARAAQRVAEGKRVVIQLVPDEIEPFGLLDAEPAPVDHGA